MLITILIIYVIVHTIVCVAIYFGTRARVFRFSEQLLPTIYFVPIWGIIIGLIANHYSFLNKTGSRLIGLEELRVADNDIRMLHIKEEETEHILVPLEEALSINDIDTRREIMMDILHQNPDEFIQLLQQARMDSDIEVIHYASTAMMEVQREYELNVQQAERAYENHPEREKTLSAYADSIKRYIDSGLIEESILYIYRKRYSDLLEVQMKKYPENMESYIAAADNYMEIKNYTSANMIIDSLLVNWPSDERSWFAKMKLCHQLNDSYNLQKTVNAVKENAIYLTPEGKTTLKFWDQSLDLY